MIEFDNDRVRHDSIKLMVSFNRRFQVHIQIDWIYMTRFWKATKVP